MYIYICSAPPTDIDKSVLLGDTNLCLAFPDLGGYYKGHCEGYSKVKVARKVAFEVAINEGYYGGHYKGYYKGYDES